MRTKRWNVPTPLFLAATQDIVTPQDMKSSKMVLAKERISQKEARSILGRLKEIQQDLSDNKEKTSGNAEKTSSETERSIHEDFTQIYEEALLPCLLPSS